MNIMHNMCLYHDATNICIRLNILHIQILRDMYIDWKCEQNMSKTKNFFFILLVVLAFIYKVTINTTMQSYLCKLL